MTYLSGNTHKFASATALILLLSPLVAIASNEVASLASPIGPADVMSVGGGLAVVIAAIILAGLLYSRSRGMHSTGKSVIKVIATQPLGPKEKIVLVEVADKQLVLGVTTSQVQILYAFDEAVVDTTETTTKFNFANRLRSVVQGSHK